MRPPVKPMATTISLVQKGHSSTPAGGHTNARRLLVDPQRVHRIMMAGINRAVLTLVLIILQKRKSP